jgi:hypothetical protein
MSVKACEAMIDENDQRQKTERLTAIEERAILKDLKELRDSLPLIRQAEDKSNEIGDVMAKKKVLGKKIHEKIEQRNMINKSIDAVKAKQAEEKGEDGEKKPAPKEEKDDKKTKHPLTIKIDNLKDGIEKLRKEKSDLKEVHEKNYQAWKDQNEIETKRKWITRIQQRLKREKAIADEEAAYQAEIDAVKAEQEEYEKKWGKPKKYQPEIDTCENLMAFLNTLKPKDLDDGEQNTGLTKEEIDGK